MRTRTAVSNSEPPARGETLPLVQRFPALASVPRVPLAHLFTPVQKLETLAPDLWIKRDDLCAEPMGGNKVRALEFLLAGLRAGDDVVTVGSAGSTHALAVATHGDRLGARVFVGRWRQEMNESAASVSDRTAALATAAPIFASPAFAYVWAWGRRLRGARWIAAGGSTPLGALGHVNAGLELVDQIDAGLVPSPARVVVPLGTGGTMAGLALAFAIAQRSIDVLGVRVVPRIVAHRSHVLRLANQTARFIEQRVHARVARVSRGGVVIAHEQYGGAYGRETPAAREARERARLAASVGLDATYSAKAFAFALSAASRGPTLFWLTFDSRPLDAS